MNKKYYCKICNYSTDRLNNYNRHIVSKKHINSATHLSSSYYEDESSQNEDCSSQNEDKYRASRKMCICCQKHISKKNYSRHIKKCKITSKYDVIQKLIIETKKQALLLEQQQHPDQAILLWNVATLGNTLGGLSSWLIGWWLGRRYPGRGLSDERQKLALKRVSRYGSPILLLSWLPLIGDPLCLAAGWSGVRLMRCCITRKPSASISSNSVW